MGLLGGCTPCYIFQRRKRSGARADMGSLRGQTVIPSAFSRSIRHCGIRGSRHSRKKGNALLRLAFTCAVCIVLQIICATSTNAACPPGFVPNPFNPGKCIVTGGIACGPGRGYCQPGQYCVEGGGCRGGEGTGDGPMCGDLPCHAGHLCNPHTNQCYDPKISYVCGTSICGRGNSTAGAKANSRRTVAAETNLESFWRGQIQACIAKLTRNRPADVAKQQCICVTNYIQSHMSVRYLNGIVAGQGADEPESKEESFRLGRGASGACGLN
jgi:hypothetical protein